MQEKAIVCSECSASLDADSRFCPSCATPVFVESTLTCPGCHKSVDANTKFCKYCAASLHSTEESKYEPPLPSQSSFPSTKEKLEKHERIAANRKQGVVSAWNEYERDKRAAEELRQGLDDGFPKEPTYKSQREKANKLAASGVILTVSSGIAVAWGHNYTSSFANSAKAVLGNMVGQADSTYQIAQYCVMFGAVGIIVGIVLFIVGLSQR